MLVELPNRALAYLIAWRFFHYLDFLYFTSHYRFFNSFSRYSTGLIFQQLPSIPKISKYLVLPHICMYFYSSSFFRFGGISVPLDGVTIKFRNNVFVPTALGSRLCGKSLCKTELPWQIVSQHVPGVLDFGRGSFVWSFWLCSPSKCEGE